MRIKVSIPSNVAVFYRRYAYHFLVFLFVSTLFSSCSLVKFENEQKPLGTTALNTRLLTQDFTREAMERIEIAADSMSHMSGGDRNLEIQALRWKIHSSEELAKVSFQTDPKIALMDTWSYCIEVKQALESPELAAVFGAQRPVALAAMEQNIAEIDRIASNVLSRREYKKIKEFVEEYAANTPLDAKHEFKHRSIRKAYLEFEDIPDTLAVQTVGSLSEVMSDATNRLDYLSGATAKRFNWRAEMIMRERGIDPVDIEARIEQLDEQFERLVQVAEESPETINEAILTFSKNIRPLFYSLNREIAFAMESVNSDVKYVDSMLLRERIALDAIILRERVALSAKADSLMDQGIKTVFDSLGDTLAKLIVFFILLFMVLTGLPFYLGYLFGKRKS